MTGTGPSTTPISLRATRFDFADTKPYAKRLEEAQRKLGMNDAIITAEGSAERPAGDLLFDGIWLHWRVDGRRGRRKGHARD